MDLAAVESIARAASAADGLEPLDEGAWRRLRHHADELTVAVEPGSRVLGGGRRPAAPGGGARGARPGRRANGCSRPRSPITATPGRRGRTATTPPRRPSRAATGSSATRELWVMRRSLSDQDGEPAVAAYDVRSFQPRRRGRAAAGQRGGVRAPPRAGLDGRWRSWPSGWPSRGSTPPGCSSRIEGDRMHGFHWTKRHSATLGEVYVVAIDPDAQGRGVGQRARRPRLEAPTVGGARRGAAVRRVRQHACRAPLRGPRLHARRQPTRT